VRKVLIIAERVYPDTGPRSHRVMSLAEGLTRFDFDVTVAAYLDPSYNYTIYSSKFINLGTSLFGIKRSDGRRLFKKFNLTLSKLLSRIIEYPNIEILRHAYPLLGEQKWDILISVARPYTVHWAVLYYLRQNDKSFIWLSDCGDPYPSSTSPWYLKYILEIWYKTTDKILVPTANSLAAYNEDFHNKFCLVPQGVNIADLRPLGPCELSAKIVRFGYCGTIYEDIRNPENFLSFVDNLDLEYEFHLWTKSQNYFIQVLPNSRSKIVFNPIVSRKELIEKLSNMHFNLNFENNNVVQTPSKLIDYYLSGRPILNVKSSLSDSDKKNFLKLYYESSSIEKNLFENELLQFDIDKIIKDLCQRVF